jgi:hypothetical protein
MMRFRCTEFNWSAPETSQDFRSIQNQLFEDVLYLEEEHISACAVDMCKGNILVTGYVLFVCMFS